MIKISIYHTRRKRGRDLSRPYNTIEFLPRISKIKSIKVNDINFSIFTNHEIPDMIISMLENLRSIF